MNVIYNTENLSEAELVAVVECGRNALLNVRVECLFSYAALRFMPCTTTSRLRHSNTIPAWCRGVAHLEAGVAVLRERSYRLHNKTGVDGLAQRVKCFLRQSDALPMRAVEGPSAGEGRSVPSWYVDHAFPHAERTSLASYRLPF